jgi:hypothetical protein
MTGKVPGMLQFARAADVRTRKLQHTNISLKRIMCFGLLLFVNVNQARNMLILNNMSKLRA